VYAAPQQGHIIYILRECLVVFLWRKDFACAIYKLQKTLQPSGVLSPKSNWFHNRIFRLSIQTKSRLRIFSTLFELQNFIWGSNTNLSTTPCRRHVGLWVTFMHKFCSVHLGNIMTFTFLHYAIVFAPFDTPTVLYLHHYRSNSDGWRTYKLCANCFRDCTPSAIMFVANSTFPNSCKCNVWLRQPPTLRNLASHSVFKLTGRTQFHLYVHAQTHLLFPSISWFHTRISLYDVLSPDTQWASSERGFTTFVWHHAWCSGTLLTTNTVLGLKKLSRYCVLKGIHCCVLFAIDP